MTSDRDVSISLSYWSSSLTDWQAINLASTFAKTFQSVLDGDGPLSKLDLFSDRNWSQVLKWNRECPEAVDACVHELIAQQVLARPDASAVCGWDASFSYRELDELSTRLAHHLVGLGVGPETFVPLCFEKSAWAIVAMLAVLKAGGAYVSLNPSHPMSRNQDMICELSASVLLTGSSCHEKFGTLVPYTICVGWASVKHLPAVKGALRNVAKDNTAFIVFTSGSTGKPKGIVMNHGAFCTSSKAHAAALCITQESRVMQFASYTYDVSMGEIFTTLMHGGCVCSIGGGQVKQLSKSHQ